MARVLLVGCGCRGRQLGAALVARGHAVRGTSRDARTLAVIAAAGVEPALADPDRVLTLLPALEQVSVLVLLLGSAGGSPASVRALHGERLDALLRAILDTTVRGVVYEASGSLPAELLAAGAALLRDRCERSRIPFELVDPPPGAASGPALLGAVQRLLSSGEGTASGSD